MRRRVGWGAKGLVLAMAAAAGAGATAGTAGAATLTTANACRYSVDGLFRDQALTLGGEVAPASVAPGGAVSVTAATASGELPGFITELGYNTGILKAGENTIPVTVWVAVASANATPATRVHRLEATARTTITTGAMGVFASATPLALTFDVPDTTWTTGAAGAVTFRQAGAGSLPTIATSQGNREPLGSVFIDARIPGGLTLQLDCQPGTARPSGETFTAAAAAPFATGSADPAAPPSPITPQPPPTGPSVRVAIAARPLTVAGRRVAVSVGCGGTGTCRGALRLSTLGAVRLGRRVRVVQIGRAPYAIPAGTRRTVTLTLTPAARALLAARASVAVLAEAEPVAADVVTRRLVFRRGAR